MILDPNKTYLEWNGAEFPNSIAGFFQAPAGSTIDWGDGTSERFDTSAQVSHLYEDGKTEHTIKISGLTSIGDYAFYDFSNLTSVTIGNSVKSIGNYAFAACSSLTSAIIPDSVTSIGRDVFSYCTSLTSAMIGNGVTFMGWGMFNGCSNLTNVTIGSGVKTIGNGAFNSCRSLTSITIPNGVTIIGSAAFYNCTSLKSIIIPESATAFGSSVFQDCSSLKTIALFPETPPTLGSTNAIPTTTTIYVQQSSKEAYKTATNWAAFADKIESNNTYLSLIRFNKKNKEFIQEQIDNSYQARQGTNNSLNSIPIADTFPTEIITIPCIPYSAFGEASDIETYCMNLLKWLCSNYPNKENITFIGQMQPNSIGFGIVHIYSTSELNDEGYPRHSSGMYVGLQGYFRLFGTTEYTFNYREI